MLTVKRYLTDGETRAIWDDTVGPRERQAGVMPRRASRIEVINEGRFGGNFHVDFSPLADATGNERFRICLTETFESYTRANAAEIEWLKRNWVLEGLSNGNNA